MCSVSWSGATICTNDLVLPIDRVDDAVLKALGGDVLRPAVVSAIIDGFLEQLLPANIENRVDDVRRRLTVLEAKIHNLTDAVEQGGADLPSIIERPSERKKERETLLMKMGSAETLHHIQVDRVAIEAKVQATMADWRGLLGGSVAEDRQLLREVLETPLKFEPDGKTYRFSGRVATGTLIADTVLPAASYV